MRLRVVAPGPVTLVLAIVLAAPTVREAILLDRIFSRPDTRLVAANYLQGHVSPGDSIYLSGNEYGHTPSACTAAAYPLRHANPTRRVSSLPRRWCRGVADLDCAASIAAHPLQRRSGPYRGADQAPYTRVALVEATDPGHRGVYDPQDALFLPLWGLSGVRHIGPTVEIFRQNPS